MTKFNVGLRIPAVHPTDPAALRAFVCHAEEIGFQSIFVGDHVFYHMDVPQSLHLLSWVAALTSRVRIGTSVMLSAYLNPVLLAKAAATIDCLSGGRLTLGMSIGGTEAEYSSIGVPMNQRVGRLLETVTIMRTLWAADENVDFEGRYHTLTSANIRPKPVQRPIPIYFGAGSEAMLKRISRRADGWVSSSQATAEVFLQRAAMVRGWAKENGRNPDELGFVKQHNVSIDPDPKLALERANKQWGLYYGDHFNLQSCAHGTPEAVAENLAAFAGSDLPSATLALEPATLDLTHLERLWEATKVLREA